jgi:LDH2 family malate/lactate/ureidoglycolate dehydrogenase
MAHLVDFYVRRLQRGRINPRPRIRSLSDTQSAATIDGDRGLGFVVGEHAMSIALEKARATGVGIVSVANSTHYGAGAYYAMQALEHDMIGLSMTTGGRLLAAPGGHGRTIGLNVFAVAAPTSREYPFVLDMATSVVAAGKLEIAARRGQPIPEGWAIDSEGSPLTDPTKLHPDGALLPLGATVPGGVFKGLGLTVFVDMMCGALSGFGTSVELEPGAATHCFAAIRIDAFTPAAAYRDKMEALVQAIESSGSSLPGAREHALSDERRRAGAVPLHPVILEGFRVAAEEFCVEYNLT